MTIMALLISLAVLYWLSAAFYKELNSPRTPDVVLRQQEIKRGESTEHGSEQEVESSENKIAA
jgi:hypothetical protein